MRTMKAAIRCVSRSISVALLLNGLMLPPAQAQQRVIVINADQPNVWTLEQAHYLLAQMHRRNLDLKAKSLEDLDPNEIAGLRFDVMRMLIEFGVTFNQADRMSNRLFSENQQFNSQRRRELTAEADDLRKQSRSLEGEIDELESQKADVKTDEEKARLDARITSKKNRQAKVDKDLENINAELKTLNVSAGELKGTTGEAEFDPTKLPKSVFDKAFEDAATTSIERFNEAPKLNASLRLDNFLQMQYEIIAKQLTLLRDELGPGERLLFLEIPQTINVAHHEANDKWAQSWWKIAGYTKRESTGVLTPVVPTSSPEPYPNQKPITTTQDVESLLNGRMIAQRVDVPRPCPLIVPEHFTNTNAINISDQTGSDTPSSIQVSATGKVTSVHVTLNGLTHPGTNEVDVLLVGPQGQNALILSDLGGPNPADNLTITLRDGAGFNFAPLTSGTFRPRNLDPASDTFRNPAPTPQGGSALSVFNGTDPNGQWHLYVMDDTAPISGSIARGWGLQITTDCEVAPQYEVGYRNVFVNLDEEIEENNVDEKLKAYLDDNGAELVNRMVRTVELIPRQSSLNVNDMKLNVRSGAFNFVLSTLFGFGSRLNIQRQREQFAQFVQQELYSSAFGKGSREFGWTFTPMPGMDRLQSGVRTTYAVVVVPNDATSLVLESNGCYFPRSAYQPLDFANTKDRQWNRSSRTSRNCGDRSKAFVVPIPAATIDGSNDFWVNRISYQSVGKGKRIVVLISGQNFSSQIGVMINGIPLPHAIGLAQPLIRDDSIAGRLIEQEFKDSEIRGRIERIDSNKIVFSFTMPEDYEGTPTITLVAPGKAIDLNWLTNIGINDQDAPATLSAANRNACQSPGNPAGCIPVGADMFFGDPVRPLRIDKVEAFRRPNNTMDVLVYGAGFKTTNRVFVNGGLQSFTVVSATLLSATNIPAPLDDEIQITLAADDKTIRAAAIINPLQLKIDNVEVISYEEPTSRKPGVLVVRIEGAGFTRGLRSSPGKVRLTVTSSTEAFLTIPNPNETEAITLTDPLTNVSVSTLVVRKPPK